MLRCSKCRKSTNKQGYCKECQKEYNRDYRIQHGQQPRKDTRICTRCKIEKDRSEFHSYQTFCKDCTKIRGGHGKGGSRRKYTDEENRIRRKESTARYKERNKEKLQALRKTDRVREMHRESARRWRKTPLGREASRSQRHIRRAMKYNNGGKFTAREWLDLLDSYKHTCVRCKCTNCALEADHIKPLSKGGSNSIDNIQPLCAKCNNWKAVQEIDYRTNL